MTGKGKFSQRNVWFHAADGTRLYAKDCGPLDSPLVPLLCLAGLTRNHRDFEPVIAAHAAQRRVIALDFRGRGDSAHAADPASYRPDVELADTLLLLDHLSLPHCAILGTSRGGIVGLLAVNLHPGRVAGLLLNDIGPRIEVSGLKRILGYVGKPVMFNSWDEAAQALAWSSVGFDDVSGEQWVQVAHRIYRSFDGRPGTDHDPLLASSLPSLEQLDRDGGPDLWPLVAACAAIPMAIIRGSGSDLLSAETVREMQQHLPEMAAVEIAGRGHVPFLDEPEAIAVIARWLAQVDSIQKGR